MQRKHKGWKLLVFLAILVSKGVALAGAKDQLYYICRNDKTVRTIRVFRAPGTEEWKITYTKSGADTFVGGGKNFEFCKSRAENIRENLEKNNWECKDRSESQVSVETPSAGQSQPSRP